MPALTSSMPPEYSSGGQYAGSMAVADVNGDDIPDLVPANDCTANCSTSTPLGGVFVFLGKRRWNFSGSCGLQLGWERRWDRSSFRSGGGCERVRQT